MLTDENVEKENETLPPSLCFVLFTFVMGFMITYVITLRTRKCWSRIWSFYLRRLSEKNANNREAGNSFLRILSPNEI